MIASALVGFVHMFNPEQILIGGGVSAQEDLFIAPVRSYVMKHVMPNFAKDLEICAAALKNEAGMVGAVYYCIQQEERVIVESSFRGWGDARIVLSERNLTAYGLPSGAGGKEFSYSSGGGGYAVLFDDEGNTVRLHHMNGILGTESMQKGALESTFSHMEKKNT